MSVRIQCVRVIQKILENQVFLKDLKENFGEEDKAFADMLILTALRRKPVIDKLISSLLTRKIKAKDKVLNYILLLASVEILYMDTPDYAVINEYVNATKKLSGNFSSKMVNAVLRQVVCHKDEMKNRTAFPADFKAILREDYSENSICQMEKMLLCEAPLDLTAKDPLHTSKELGGVLFENGTIRLRKIKTNPTLLKGYDEGAWFVQDLAAALPVSLLPDIKGKRVLDLCAAPGGKTAQLLWKGAVVTALDVDAERLEKLKENAKRLNISQNLTVVCDDALAFFEKTNEKYDLILIDAPCSATGTFRRHPEIMYFKTKQDVQKQAEIQKLFLNACVEKLKDNGQILYVTCSISKTEGEKQIQNFLKKYTDFEILAFENKNFSFKEAQKINECILDKGVLRTLPYDMENEGGMDSFFAALLKKKG